mgnify:CR=1 FL=1|jgi:1,4-dihydroxy-2-naphthoyl-CoA hydrolase
MSIWFTEYTVPELNKHNQDCMVSHCGIEITEVTNNSLIGVMQVDERTRQPFGILHGGANCVLAESLGSIAANLTCDANQSHAVGLSITTNHVKATRNGEIKGIARPLHIGKTTQVWEIKTYNKSEQLTSSTTLTMAIVKKIHSTKV